MVSATSRRCRMIPVAQARSSFSSLALIWVILIRYRNPKSTFPHLDTLGHILLVDFRVNRHDLRDDVEERCMARLVHSCCLVGGATSMVNRQGRLSWIILKSYLISLQQHRMQEVSQGSLKLEAHHDKIANGSHSTKTKFLEQELYYLTQLKEQCKALQVTLRPSSNPTPHRIARLIQNLRKQLAGEVISTRREIALAQLPLCAHFEQHLVQSFEEGVGRMDKRLERIEGLVQAQEDKNRAKQILGTEGQLAFKNAMLRKISQEYIKRSQIVQHLLKRKLAVVAKLKAMQEKQASHSLVAALKTNLTQKQYLAERNRRYYRNKSQPPRRPTQSGQSHSAAFYRSGQAQRNPSYQQLHYIQRSVFVSELEDLRSQNGQLQQMIDSLTNAIRKRENLELLHTLATSQKLQAEESKARELLFYLFNNESTRDRIESCSYYWAALSPTASPKNKWKSKEDNTEEEKTKAIKERGMLRTKRKVVSAEKAGQGRTTGPVDMDKLRVADPKEHSFSKAALLKSNEKTNTSLQC